MSGAGRRATILAGVLAAMLFAPVASWATLSWSGPTRSTALRSWR